ncbi:MAG TPA: DUF4118 domain-containing protein, partial [Steroidobacteraceae bacterium]|nr:DUF4118 domain-containing protein [Steroidobacteraceae bacterium]
RPFRSSTTETLLRTQRDIDVLVIGGSDDAPRLPPAAADSSIASGAPEHRRLPRYVLALASTLTATALCWMFYRAFAHLGQANLVMVYLLNTALVAVYGGRRAAALSAVLGVLAFDFMFVPPRYSFAVSDVQYLITFAVMLSIGLIIGNLNASVRLQARVAGHRERRTALLYAMSRQLAQSRSREEMARLASHHVAEVFASRAVVLFADEHGRVGYPRAPPDEASYRSADLGVAQWVFDHGKPAGLGTDTLSGGAGVHLPLSGSERVFGVLAVLPDNPRGVTLPEQFRLLETFAAQIGLALERAEFAAHAQAAEVRAETEAIRNALLASISHDLRTPLATIAAGAATLAGNLDALSSADRRALAESVSDEAMRMSERITTLLDLVRLETGAIRPRFEQYELAELVGSVLHRLEARLRGHLIRIELPPELPLLYVDGRLIDQVLENLLDNAGKYTPAGSQIRISARELTRQIEVSVEDNGPGLPGSDPEILFEKFQRGAPESAAGGIGLGLAICRTIVRLHDGRIWAEQRAPHGAAFRFSVPKYLGPVARLDADAASPPTGVR